MSPYALKPPTLVPCEPGLTEGTEVKCGVCEIVAFTVKMQTEKEHSCFFRRECD